MSGAAVVDSSRTRRRLTVGEADYEVFRLAGVEGPDCLPFSLKVLLENLLRNEDGRRVTADDICALAAWDPGADPTRRSGSPRTRGSSRSGGVHAGHRKLDVVERSSSACSDQCVDLTQRRARFMVPADRGIDG